MTMNKLIKQCGTVFLVKLDGRVHMFNSYAEADGFVCRWLYREMAALWARCEADNFGYPRS